MTRNRDLANLLDSNGDVKSSALDNVPASNDASALTTGTLPVARIADTSISTAKLSNDAITNVKLNLTYDTKTTDTGDGSDTTFTINSGRAVDDVLVFVNGICLVPTDDYTISGTTLTFSTAPTNGAEISIRYLPK
tara:strand:- start:1228 stop:1635 length:408 start_codon:yes stop_codon:yes gene_type:complete